MKVLPMQPTHTKGCCGLYMRREDDIGESYQGNPVYNRIWEQARIDLAGWRQIGVPSDERLFVVLGLAVPGQPDLP